MIVPRNEVRGGEAVRAAALYGDPGRRGNIGSAQPGFEHLKGAVHDVVVIVADLGTGWVRTTGRDLTMPPRKRRQCCANVTAPRVIG